MYKNRLSAFMLSERYYELALLLLRIFIGALIMRHGIMKWMDYDNLSATFFDPIGLGQKTSLTLIMLAETFGGLFIMLGLLTRLSAIALIFGMCVAAFFAKPEFSFSASESPILYLGIFVVILIAGPGRYSFDRAIFAKDRSYR